MRLCPFVYIFFTTCLDTLFKLFLLIFIFYSDLFIAFLLISGNETFDIILLI